MVIKTSEYDDRGVAVVAVEGIVNNGSDTPLKHKFDELINEKGFTKIIVEVTMINDIDSWGIGLIVSLLNTIRKKGGDLRLAGTFAPQVSEAFDLCGLTRVFTIYKDVKTGLSDFNL